MVEKGDKPSFPKASATPLLPHIFLLSHSPTPLSFTLPPSAVLGMNSYSTSQLASSSSDLSFASQSIMGSFTERQEEASREKSNLPAGSRESSPLPSPSAPALVLSNSGKRIEQSGSSKKYVKQVTGRHNDTELHLAAQRGDVEAVRQILGEIDAQMEGTAGGAEFDAAVAEIRTAVVNEVNELGETAMLAAAGRGHLAVVRELLKHSSRECLLRKNNSGFDALHKAAGEGHHGINL